MRRKDDDVYDPMLDDDDIDDDDIFGELEAN